MDLEQQAAVAVDHDNLVGAVYEWSEKVEGQTGTASQGCSRYLYLQFAACIAVLTRFQVIRESVAGKEYIPLQYSESRYSSKSPSVMGHTASRKARR